MKAKHGLYLLILSQVLNVINHIAGSQMADFDWTWKLSSVAWTLGLIIIFIKALQSNKLKSFLEE